MIKHHHHLKQKDFISCFCTALLVVIILFLYVMSTFISSFVPALSSVCMLICFAGLFCLPKVGVDTYFSFHYVQLSLFDYKFL